VYDQVATNLVLGPAGMTTATFDPAVGQAADHAVGNNGSTLVQPQDNDCAVERPPGGVIASVVDYAHLAEMLLSSGGSVLQPSSVAAMEAGRVPTDLRPGNTEQYGYGLYVREGYEHIVWHNGFLDGYQSSIYLVPAQSWAVVVFYNSSNGSPDAVSQDAVDTFLLPPGVTSPVLTTPSSTWSRDEGTYASTSGLYNEPSAGLGTVTVALQGNLLIATSDDPSMPLTQVAGDTFQFPYTSPWTGGNTEDVTFWPDDAGTPSWFATRIGVGARE
jgi:hypothetical protein